MGQSEPDEARDRSSGEALAARAQPVLFVLFGKKKPCSMITHDLRQQSVSSCRPQPAPSSSSGPTRSKVTVSGREEAFRLAMLSS